MSEMIFGYKTGDNNADGLSRLSNINLNGMTIGHFKFLQTKSERKNRFSLAKQWHYWLRIYSGDLSADFNLSAIGSEGIRQKKSHFEP